MCQICHQREATIHITKIVNGEKTELHLCEVCAKELAQKGELLYIDMEPSFSSIVSTLLGKPGDSSSVSMSMVTQETKKCPNCGMSLAEFQKSGRLGCSECYKAFKPYLLPVLRRIQGNVQHSGKRPKVFSSKESDKTEIISMLRKELEEAVKREDYERAAVLRDKIKELSSNG